MIKPLTTTTASTNSNLSPCSILRFMLIRHGEALTNLREDRFGGRINPSPLTLRGERQAHQTGRYLGHSGYKFDRVYSSCAVRAIHTAEIITGYTGFDYKNIIHTEEVAEIDRGKWTSLPRKLIITPAVLAEMDKDPYGWKAPGGESLLDVRKRMTDFICGSIAKKWSQKVREIGSLEGNAKIRKDKEGMEHKDEFEMNGSAKMAPFTIGIFSHATALKCFLQGISNSSVVHNPNFQIDNCSMTEVLYYPMLNSWKISKLNFLPPRPKL